MSFLISGIEVKSNIYKKILLAFLLAVGENNYIQFLVFLFAKYILVSVLYLWEKVMQTPLKKDISVWKDYDSHLFFFNLRRLGNSCGRESDALFE